MTKHRARFITPLGYRVLRALDRGTYKAIPSPKRKSRGKRQKKRK